MAGLNVDDPIFKDSAEAEHEVRSQAAQVGNSTAKPWELSKVGSPTPVAVKRAEVGMPWDLKPMTGHTQEVSFEAPVDSTKRTFGELATDTFDDLRIGTANAASGVAFLGRKAIQPIQDAAVGYSSPEENKDFEDLMGGLVKELQQGQSAKRQAQRQGLAKSSESDSFYDGFMGALKFMKDNPSAAVSMAVESIPGMFVGGVAGGAAARVAAEKVLMRAAAAGPLSEAGLAAAGKLSGEVAGRAAGWAAGAAEGIQTLGQVGQQIEQTLDEKGIKDPKLRAGAIAHAIPAAIFTMLTGRVFGAAEALPFVKAGMLTKDGVVKATLKSLAKEATEEGIQNPNEQLMQNLGERYAGVDTPVMKGVGAAAATGLVTGGVMGAGSGAVGGVKNRLAGINTDEVADVAPKPVSNVDANGIETVDELPGGGEVNVKKPVKYDGGVDFEQPNIPAMKAENMSLATDEKPANTIEYDPGKAAELIASLNERVRNLEQQKAAETMRASTVTPTKTTQQIIDEQTGVARNTPNTKADAKVAANEVVGVKQTEGQIEAPLTSEEDKDRRVDGAPMPVTSFGDGEQVIVRDKTLPKLDGKVGTVNEIRNAEGKVVRREVAVGKKIVGSPAALFERVTHATPTTPGATGRTAVAPTQEQKAAGNYEKADVRFAGFDGKIENVAGYNRSGKDADGKKWRVSMPVDYGYLRRTKGSDADAIDAFFGPKENSDKVYVVDQQNADGSFDEHKAMVRFGSEKEARAAYVASFSDGKGAARIQSVTEMTIPEFKEWAKSLDGKKETVAQYIAQKQAAQTASANSEQAPQSAPATAAQSAQPQENQNEQSTNESGRGSDGVPAVPSQEVVQEGRQQGDAGTASVEQPASELPVQRSERGENEGNVTPAPAPPPAPPAKPAKPARVASTRDTLTKPEITKAQEEWNNEYEPLTGEVIPFEKLGEPMQDEWAFAVRDGKATQDLYDKLDRRHRLAVAAERRSAAIKQAQLDGENDFDMAVKAAVEFAPTQETADHVTDDALLSQMVSKVREVFGPEFSAVAVTPSIPRRIFSGAIGKLFGHNVVYFESDKSPVDGTAISINGGTMFIDNKSNISTYAILGHELTHLLKRNSPSVYAAMEDAVLSMVPQEQLNRFNVQLGRDNAAQGSDRIVPESKMKEELVANFVGDRFVDPSFWKSMAQSTESNFAAIAYHVIHMLQRVSNFVDALRKKQTNDLNSKTYLGDVSDIQDVSEAVKTALLEYARDKRKSDSSWSFADFLISAYHGSAVGDMKRLLTDFVHSGTGATMQGWGVYLTASPEIGSKYRNNLSIWDYIADNIRVTSDAAENVWTKLFDSKAEIGAAKAFLSNGGDYKPANVLPGEESKFNSAAMEIAHTEAHIRSIEEEPYGFHESDLSEDEKSEIDRDNARELKHLYTKLKALKKLQSIGKPTGALYKVGFNVTADDLLDWNAPYSAQPTKVKVAFKEMFGAQPAQSQPGSVLYGRLQAMLGSEKAASMALRDKGVFGAQYDWPAPNGEMTKNYVVYDDSKLSDVERVDDSQPADFSVKKSNDPAAPAQTVPYKRRGVVEVYAVRGNDVLGMAAYDSEKKTWDVHLADRDMRDAKANIQSFTTANDIKVAELTKMFKDAFPFKDGQGVKLIRRKDSPDMPEDVRSPSDLVDIDPTYRKPNGAFVTAVEAALNVGDAENGRALELQRQLQDRFVYAKIAQDAIENTGVKIDSRINLYRHLTMYSDRAGNALEKFADRYLEPIHDQLAEMAKNGGKISDVDDYLMALHAKERNTVIRERDPSNDHGSGITDEKADEILGKYKNAKFKDQLDNIATQMKAISDFKVGTMLNRGLITQDAANNLLRYQNYVTLKGDEDEMSSLGKSLGIKSKPLKYATGRETEATNTLMNTLIDAEAKIMRGYQNEPNNALLSLAEAAPDPNYWTVEEVKSKKAYDEKTGTVKFVSDAFANLAPNVFVAYRDGNPYKVTVKDPQLAQALNSQFQNDGALVDTMRAWNRYLSTFITTLNPEWFITNGIRDVQSAALNLSSDETLPPGIEKSVMSQITDWGKNHKAIYDMERSDKDSDFARSFKRLEELGGIVKFYGFKTLEDKARDIQLLEDRALNQGLKAKTINALEKSKALDVVRWFEDVNMAVEAVPRVAVFRALTEAGWDEQRAADYAKNLTVNFSRRGAADTIGTKLLQSGYLFFNPAVQGSARLIEAMASPTGKKIAAGLFGLGLLAAFIGHAGDDDKDGNGVSDFEQISASERARYLIIGGAKIPLPLGWNAFYAAGSFMGDAMFGKKSVGKASWEATKAMIDAFNPVGNSDSKDTAKWLAKMAAPQVVDPLVELALNENSFGSPIRKEVPAGQVQYQPNSQMYFPSVSAPMKAFTRMLNEISGGSTTVKGAIDINPENLDYLAKTIFPGVGATALRAVSVASKSADDRKIEAREIPFVRQIIAEPSKGYQMEKMNEIKEEMQNLANRQKNGDEEDRKTLAKYPGWAGVNAVLSDANSQIKELSQRRAKIMDGKIKVANEGPELDRIEEKIRTIENRVIARYEAAKAKGNWN